MQYYAALKSGDIDPRLSDEQRSGLQRFTNAIDNMCERRRFFSTSSGRLG